MVSTRRRLNLAAVFAFVASAAFLVGRAGAQPTPAASDEAPAENTDEYDRVIAEALTNFNANEFEQARALFERAHAIRPSARTLRALGLSDVALEYYALAQQELEAALLDARKPLTAEQRAEVTELLTWMRDNLAVVRLHYEPPQARAKIDQRPVTRGDLLLEPGLHELQVEAPGFETQQQRFQLVLTKHPLELSVELRKLSDEPLATRGGNVDDDRASSTWLWVGVPSLLATLTGAGFLTAGLVEVSDAEHPSGFDRVERFYERSDRGRLYTTLGLTLGGVGLAGMITAAVIKLNDARADDADDAADTGSGFAYVVTPGQIAVTRRF